MRINFSGCILNDAPAFYVKYLLFCFLLLFLKNKNIHMPAQAIRNTDPHDRMAIVPGFRRGWVSRISVVDLTE